MKHIKAFVILVLVFAAACASVPNPTSAPPTGTFTPPIPTTLAPTSTRELPTPTATAVPPTPTPVPPTLTPTPRPTAELVLSEDFSDTSGWWCQPVTGTVEMYCQDGEFHAASKEQNQFRWRGRPNSYRDFSMQVQARFIGDAGAASLVFRAGTPPLMYVFWVFPEGKFSLMKYGASTRTNLIEPTASPAIKAGAANILQVVAQGSRFTLYANNVELAHIVDASYSEGSVGIGAADGAHVAFDNLKVWVPLTTPAP